MPAPMPPIVASVGGPVESAADTRIDANGQAHDVISYEGPQTSGDRWDVSRPDERRATAVKIRALTPIGWTSRW